MDETYKHGNSAKNIRFIEEWTKRIEMATVQKNRSTREWTKRINMATVQKIRSTEEWTISINMATVQKLGLQLY